MNCHNRFSIHEITPGRIYNAVARRFNDIPHLFAWETHPSARENKKILGEYKDAHKGKRCFIVANGPSLKKTDLGLLAEEYSFGLNRIYLNFDRSAFRPTYYVAVNSLILEQFGREISQLDVPKFVNWTNRDLFGDPGSNLAYLKSKLVFSDFFQFDLTKPMVFGATVTFVALQLAYYMGFQKVILVGLDHNYAEQGTPSNMEVRESTVDRSHFHSQYFPKGSVWELPDLRRSEIEFRLAQTAYETGGREILDATIGGKCQIFKKVDYLSLFE